VSTISCIDVVAEIQNIVPLFGKDNFGLQSEFLEIKGCVRTGLVADPVARNAFANAPQGGYIQSAFQAESYLSLAT